MIQRVALYFVLPMCIIAFFLALAGVQQVQFGDDYYVFMKNVGNTFSNWRLQIPDIPKVPQIQDGDFDDKGLILKVIIAIGRFFVNFINIIISILNMLINIINIVVQLIQFILTVIYQCKDFIKRLSEVRTISYV